MAMQPRTGLMSSTALTPGGGMPNLGAARGAQGGGGFDPSPMGQVGPPNAAPAEEQAQYNQFVGSALQLVYNEKVFPQLMQRITGTKDPIGGLADATNMVIDRVREAAEQRGEKISGDVMFHGGAEILENIADAATQTGVHQFGQKEIEAAGLRAADQYRARHQDDLDQADVMDGFDQMMEQDQTGVLAKRLRVMQSGGVG